MSPRRATHPRRSRGPIRGPSRQDRRRHRRRQQLRLEQLEERTLLALTIGVDERQTFTADVDDSILNRGTLEIAQGLDFDVSGSFSQWSEGTLRINIGESFGGLGWFGDAFIDVSEEASLAGRLEINATDLDASSLAPGDRLPLMRFQMLGSGRFESVTGMGVPGRPDLFFSLNYVMKDEGVIGETKPFVEVYGIDLVILEVPKIIAPDGSLSLLSATSQKDSFAIVTHGWGSSVTGTENNFHAIAASMAALAPEWDVAKFNWASQASFFESGLPNYTAERAYDAGESIAMLLADMGLDESYTNYHFTAHSAGTWVISALADKLPESAEIEAAILDGFTPDIVRVAGVGFGVVSENFDRGQNIYAAGDLWRTQDHRDNLVNVDVTTLVPGGQWFNWFDSHSYPHGWFRETVTRALPADPDIATLLGFGLTPLAARAEARQVLDDYRGRTIVYKKDGTVVLPVAVPSSGRMPLPPEYQGSDADASVLETLAASVATKVAIDAATSRAAASAAEGIPVFGEAAADSGGSSLEDLFDLSPPPGVAAGDSGQVSVRSLIEPPTEEIRSLLDDLAAVGFRIESAASPAEMFRWILGDGVAPQELIRLSYSRSVSAEREFSGSGAASFGPLAAELAATLTGSVASDASLSFGVAPEEGVFVVEGGEIGISFDAESAVAAATSAGVFVDAGLTADAVLSANLLIRIDDQNGIDGELIFLEQQSLADVLSTQTTRELSGSLMLTEAAVTVDVLPGLGMLPEFTVAGTGSYDLVTGEGEFTVSDDAMLDAATQVVNAGIQRMQEASAALARLTEPLPLIGNDVSSVIDQAIASRLDFAFPTTGVRTYLEDRGFEVIALPSFEALINGQTGGELLQLRYAQSAVAAAGEFSFSDVMQAGPAALNLSGTASVAPNLAIDATFGIDLAHGPYLIEGATVGVELPVQGTFSGTAGVGNIVGIDASVEASFAAGANLSIENGDDVPGQRLYFFSTAAPAIDFAEDTSYSVYGTAELVATLSVSNPLTQIPAFRMLPDSILAPFSWTADIGYDLLEGSGTYTVREDRRFDAIVSMFADGSQGVMDMLLDHLDEYNPLPQGVRDLLTTKIPIIDQTVLGILKAPAEAELIVNPQKFKGRSEADLERNNDGSSSRVDVNFDLFTPANVIAILTGEAADIVSIDIAQRFEAPTEPIPVAAIPVFSFLGIVNVDVTFNVLINFSFDVNLQAGFDTNGFYVRQAASPEELAFSLTGSVGVEAVGTGRLVVLPLVELGVAAELAMTGGVAIYQPDNDDDKLRAYELLNLDNYQVGLRADLLLGLDASLGAEPFVLEVGSDYTIPLFSAGGGSLGDLDEQVRAKQRDFKRSFDKAVDKAVLYAFPGAAILGEVIDAVGEGLEVTRKEAERFAGVVAAEGKRAIQTVAAAGARAESALRDAGRSFAEKRDLLAKGFTINDLQKGLANLGSTVGGWLFGGRKPVEITGRQSFTAVVGSDRVLRIEPRAVPDGESRPIRQALTVGVSGGELVIDGEPFLSYEATSKSNDGEGGKRRYHYEWVTQENIRSLPLADFDRIEIVGTVEADSFVVMPEVPLAVVIRGGDGDDLIQGGSANDQLFGEGGNDRIFGGAGNDTLSGGGGNDQVFGQLGNDTLSGDDGDDLLDESLGGGTVDVGLSLGPGEADRSQETNTLLGGAGNDVLRGSPGPDSLAGGTGNDVASGGAGDDTIDGETGNDRLYGDAGNDTIRGGEGDDVAEGGAGNDLISGDAGNDTLFGDDPADSTSGNDRISGGTGRDFLAGGRGEDFLDGGAGADMLDGGDSNDEMIGGPNDVTDGNDLIDGGAGVDTITSGWGGPTAANYAADATTLGDILRGGDGNDAIDGSASGAAFIYGDAGDDLLRAGSGPGQVLGGTGNDTIYGGANAAGRTAALYGDDGDDEMHGTAFADAIYGGRGADRIFAYGGADAVDVGTGAADGSGGDALDLGSGAGDPAAAGGAGGGFASQGGDGLDLGVLADEPADALAAGLRFGSNDGDAVFVVEAGQTIVDSTNRLGSFGLIKRGSGTLVIDAANVFSGGIVVEEGELIIRNPSGFGSGGLTVRDGAAVTIETADQRTLLEGALVNEGLITVAAGTLAVAGGGSIAGAIVVPEGQTLEVAASESDGAGSLELVSGGRLIGAGSLTVTGGQFLANGGTIDPAMPLSVFGGTVTFDASTDIGRVTLAGGTIGGSAPLSIRESFAWTAGTIRSAGGVVVTATATGTASGGGVKQITGVLRNEGSLDLSAAIAVAGTLRNAGRLLLADGWLETGSAAALIDNLASGVFTFRGTAAEVRQAATADPEVADGRFVNSGRIVSETTDSDSVFIALLFENKGILEIRNGHFVPQGQVVSSGTIDIATGSELRYGNWIGPTAGGNTFELRSGAVVSGAGVFRVNGNFVGTSDSAQVANLVLEGGKLVGPGTLTVAGHFDWLGGDLGVSAYSDEYQHDNGVVEILAGGAGEVRVPGTSPYGGGHRLWSTLRNHGTLSINAAMTDSYGIQYQLEIAGALENAAGGSVYLTGGNGNEAMSLNIGRFTNAGSVIYDEPGHFVIWSRNAAQPDKGFVNNGIVEIRRGTLELAGDHGFDSGEIRIGVDSTYHVSGSKTWLATASVSGAGLVRVTGHLANEATISIERLDLRYRLTGSGTLVLPGYTQLGDTPHVSCTLEQEKVVIAEGAIVEVLGHATVSGDIQNSGSWMVRDSNLSVGEPFVNLPLGTIHLLGDGAGLDGNLINQGHIIRDDAIDGLVSDSLWRVAIDAPADDWTLSSFDESAFNPAVTKGFTGSRGFPAVNDIWAEREDTTVWMRKRFSLTEQPTSSSLTIAAQADLEIYLNGIPLDLSTLPAEHQMWPDVLREGFELAGRSGVYELDVSHLLEAGENVIAVRATSRAAGPVEVNPGSGSWYEPPEHRLWSRFTIQGADFVGAELGEVQSGTLDFSGTFENSGTIIVRDGYLRLGGESIRLGGTVSIDRDAEIQFATRPGSYYRDLELLDGVSITGEGLVRPIGASLHTAGRATIHNLVLDGGSSLDGPGTLTVTGSLEWLEGRIGSSDSRTGTVEIAPTAVATMPEYFAGGSGYIDRYVYSRLVNKGSLAIHPGARGWGDTGRLILVGIQDGLHAPILENAAGAELRLDGGGITSDWGSFSNAGRIIARGTPVIDVAGYPVFDGDGIFVVGWVPGFRNTGAMEAQGRILGSEGLTLGGRWELGGSLSVEGSLQAGGSGTLRDLHFFGDSLMLNAAAEEPVDIPVHGTLTWHSGTFGGAGRLIVEPSATVIMTGADEKILGVNMVNQGEIEISGALVHEGIRAPLLENAAGGTLTVLDATIGIPIRNDGTFRKDGEVGTASLRFPFTSTGLVEVTGGTLTMSASVNNSGGIVIAEDATYEVAGDVTWSFGTTVEGPGRVLVRGGSLSNYAMIAVGQLMLARGSIRGRGTLTVLESFEWTGGTLSDAGVIEIARTAIGRVPIADTYISYEPRTLAATLRNYGILEIDAGSYAAGMNLMEINAPYWNWTYTVSPALINAEGGVLRLLGDGSATTTVGTLIVGGQLVNAGRLERVGSGQFVIYASESTDGPFKFVNAGTVVVEQGTLVLGGSRNVDLTASSPQLFSEGSLDEMSTMVGRASLAKSVTIVGERLAGNVVATAPAGFEISVDGTVFGPELTLLQTSGSLAAELFVRLAAGTAAGVYAGTVRLITAESLPFDIVIPESTVLPRAVSVAPLVTNRIRPDLAGGVNDPLASVSVTIAGWTYEAVNSGDGTWTLAGTNFLFPLTAGVYDVTVTAIDSQGVEATETVTGGLTIDLTPPVVTVIRQASAVARPRMTGTIDDPAATVTVSLHGTVYSAVNAGDGTWSLDGSMLAAPLPNGVYDVVLTATDAAGNTASDQVTGAVTIAIDALAPVATFGTIDTPRSTSIDSVSVVFDEAVSGVSITAFRLTRDDVAIPLTGATLTGTGASYTLAGISDLTSEYGTYRLSLAASGSGIVDAVGNAISEDAEVSWVVQGINLPPFELFVSPRFSFVPATPATGLPAALVVADLYVYDDGVGTNLVTLSGDDAADFEVLEDEFGSQRLALKAGTVLDPTVASEKTVVVTVQDPELPDDSLSEPFTIMISTEPVRLVFGSGYGDVISPPAALVGRGIDEVPVTIIGAVDPGTLGIEDFVLERDGVVVPWAADLDAEYPEEPAFSLYGEYGSIQSIGHLTAPRGTYTIRFTGDATDIVDTPLAEASFSWTNIEPVSFVSGPDGWAMLLEADSYGLSVWGQTVDAAGVTFVVGSLSGAADFDPRPDAEAILSSEDGAGFIARYDAAGSLLGVWQIGAGIQAVAEANGRLAIAGTFDGAGVDLDPRPDVTAGFGADGQSGFVVVVDAITGEPVATTLLSVTPADGWDESNWYGYGVEIAEVVLTDDGRGFLSGSIRSAAVTIPTGEDGSVSLAVPADESDGFVMAIDAAGAATWATRLLEGPKESYYPATAWSMASSSDLLALGVAHSGPLGILPEGSSAAQGAVAIGLDAATGDYRWHAAVAEGLVESGTVHVAATPDGRVHAAGFVWVGDYSAGNVVANVITVDGATGSAIGSPRSVADLLATTGDVYLMDLLPRADGSTVLVANESGGSESGSMLHLLDLGPWAEGSEPTVATWSTPQAGWSSNASLTADGRVVLLTGISESDSFPVGAEGEPQRLVSANQSATAIWSIDDPFAAAPDPSITVPPGETATDTTERTGDEQVVKRGAGTLVLDLANSHSGGTLVEEGTVVVRNTAALGLGTLEVRSGATVKLETGFGTVALPRLDLAAGAVLDLGEATLTIGPGGADEATIRQWIIAGRGNGAFNGTSGIRSSAAAAATGSRTIGYTVRPDGSATVMFTAVGDLNLDRKVDVFDLLAMDSGGRFGSPQAAGWSQGDLNYDGRTNVFDLLGIDTAGTFNTGTIVPAANGLKASGTSFTETAVSAATSTTTLESPAPSRTAVFASFAAGIQWEMVAADGDDDEESS